MKPKNSYSQEKLDLALNAVRKNGLSISKAARTYGVPKTTLWDKFTGRTPIIRKMGRMTVLSTEEEEKLVK